MKLSNRILIGFFAFILIYMTAAFAEIRFRGNINQIDDSNSLIESVNITNVSYLVVMPNINKRVTLIGSDKPRIEVRSISGDLLQHLDYSTAGDTLILNQLNITEDRETKISVFVPKDSFTGMTVNNSAVVIKELNQNTLTITQTGGWVRMNENIVLGKLNIKVSENGNFRLSDTQLDTLSVMIEHSEVTIMSPVRRIQGAMSNDSYLKVRGADDIQFKKDESSRLYLN